MHVSIRVVLDHTPGAAKGVDSSRNWIRAPLQNTPTQDSSAIELPRAIKETIPKQDGAVMLTPVADDKSLELAKHIAFAFACKLATCMSQNGSWSIRAPGVAKGLDSSIGVTKVLLNPTQTQR